MQNRFKFRVWNQDSKKMVYHDFYIDCDGNLYEENFSDEGWDEGVFLFDNGIIMQCTGLKDKKGQLIYEGDICTTHGYVGEIKWSDDYSGHIFKHLDADGDCSLSGCEPINIIGNIYQSQELLK